MRYKTLELDKLLDKFTITQYKQHMLLMLYLQSKMLNKRLDMLIRRHNSFILKDINYINQLN